MPENQEKEKVIMGYKVKFKTEYDEVDADGEFIKLTIQISDELKSILKKSSIMGDVPVRIGISSMDSSKVVDIIRYKVKTVINNTLETVSRDLLFSKSLVNEGKISINILDVNKVLYIIERVKSGIRMLLETVIGISNLSQEVSYDIVSQ